MQKHACKFELNYTLYSLDQGKTRIELDARHKFVGIRGPVASLFDQQDETRPSSRLGQ